MFKEFKAIAYALNTDRLLPPVGVNIGSAEDEEDTTMAIHPTCACVVHITKSQAMEFFGLVEPT